MVAFGNPVLGTIRPHSDPPGPYWRVTATFGQLDADHPTPHEGVDIGNMKCGDPVIAVADGTVSLAGYLGAALVVRVLHPQFPGYESGYAHLSSKYVVVGQAVKKGQVLGTLGSSGATACHLHWGTKLNGVEVDGWPLLDQNSGGDMLKGKVIQQLGNRRCTVLGDNTRLRPSPGTAEPELALLSAGEGCYVEWLVDGGLALGSTRWYGMWKQTPRGIEYGYVSEKLLSPLTPIEQSGHTDAELIEAARKAGHNAAVDVQAVGVTALNTVAAKYP